MTYTQSRSQILSKNLASSRQVPVANRNHVIPWDRKSGDLIHYLMFNAAARWRWSDGMFHRV